MCKECPRTLGQTYVIGKLTRVYKNSTSVVLRSYVISILFYCYYFYLDTLCNNLLTVKLIMALVASKAHMQQICDAGDGTDCTNMYLTLCTRNL